MLQHCFETPFRSIEDIKEKYSHRLVSRGWKELIEGTPSLWSEISTEYPTAVIWDSLQWSRSHPLTVYVSYHDRHGGKQLEILLKHLQLLRMHSHRWVVLEVYATNQSSDGFPSLVEFVAEPAPKLHRIEVLFPSVRDSPPPTINLAGGVAQHLKQMRLSELFVPWSSDLFVGLEEFSLRTEVEPPAEEMVNIFVKSPSLRIFDLYYGGMGGHESPSPSTSMDPHSFHVTARRLEAVALSFGHPQLASYILSRVSMPNCDYISIEADIDDPNPFDILEAGLAQFVPRIVDMLRSHVRTELWAWYGLDGNFQWAGSSIEQKFQIDVQLPSHSMNVLVDNLRRLAHGCGSEFELSVHLSDLSEMESLHQWAVITRLTIDQYEPLDAFLDLLGRFLVDAQNGISWPFPKLRELDLSRRECSLHALFGMLSRRYLPIFYARSMEEAGISVLTPPKLDIRMRGTLEDGEPVIVTALQKHWGVKSLNGVASGTEEKPGAIGSQ
ncbi:hypothetical protein FRB90_011370 [Tulasnella sp. 427]|nr:hypothetical protein FRB90_011370 [Tulasnella sp. 427]